MSATTFDLIRTRVAWGLGALVVALTALVLLTSCVLARPVPRRVGDPPLAIGAASVRFPSASGSLIGAWLAPGERGRGAVLLLHGASESRLVMLARARFLHRAGYTVLAPDFQAHGESPGRYVTFGALESRDAQAALAFLRACAPSERVGVIGISMGGAAALLDSGPVRPDALVLESVYPTIREAVADRLQVWLGPLGGVGPALAPLLLRMVGARIGVSENALRPIDRIAAVQAPLFVLAGTADRYTHLAEARALYARATAPKQLWEVNGAGHEDLYAYDGPQYERRVGAFLAGHLRAASGAPAHAATIATATTDATTSRACPAARA